MSFLYNWRENRKCSMKFLEERRTSAPGWAVPRQATWLSWLTLKNGDMTRPLQRSDPLPITPLLPLYPAWAAAEAVAVSAPSVKKGFFGQLLLVSFPIWRSIELQNSFDLLIKFVCVEMDFRGRDDLNTFFFLVR